MILSPIKALGTTWYIEIFNEEFNSTLVHQSCVDWLQRFEARYSRFKEDSWLSKLNKNKFFDNPDEEFVDLLNTAIEYYEATNHVFNIAVGEQLESIGYDSNYSFTNSSAVGPAPDLRSALVVTPNRIVLHHGSLDLGGIGKGYAIDGLSQYLQKEYNLPYHLINGGGDIYATSDWDKTIEIHLSHPSAPEESIGTTQLHNSAFASSSPFIRSWTDKKTAEINNHLLTKNTWASYVVASAATTADVFATTLCIEPTITVPATVSKCLITRNGRVLEADEIFRLFMPK